MEYRQKQTKKQKAEASARDEIARAGRKYLRGHRLKQNRTKWASQLGSDRKKLEDLIDARKDVLGMNAGARQSSMWNPPMAWAMNFSAHRQ